MNDINFQPLNNRVLIKRDDAPTHVGNIALPDSSEKPGSGTVVAVSPPKPDDKAPFITKMTAKPTRKQMKFFDEAMKRDVERTVEVLEPKTTTIYLDHVNVGDVVFFPKFAGTDLTIDGVVYVVVKEDELLGVVRGSK